jgi:hypothetical protein
MADETAKLLTCEETGRVGGFTRAKNLSAEKRREIAKRAAQARWRKKNGGGGPEGGGAPNGGGDVDGRPTPGILSSPVPNIMSTLRRGPKPCRKSFNPNRKASASVTRFDFGGNRAA